MRPNFDKSPDGLLPAVVQDENTGRVLFAGFMNRKSFKRTLKHGIVTMYSRKRGKTQQELDVEGEVLELSSFRLDCRGTSILIRTKGARAVCHKGKETCFGEKNDPFGYLAEFENYTRKRKYKPVRSSLTSRVFERGMNQIAKKLGEEAVELVIEAKDSDDDLFKAEAADLLYYFMLMVVEREIPLEDVIGVLQKRKK